MTHEQRVYHHMYETNEGIAEQSERIASLEELALDMLDSIAAEGGWVDEFEDRMRELVVDDG